MAGSYYICLEFHCALWTANGKPKGSFWDLFSSLGPEAKDEYRQMALCKNKHCLFLLVGKESIVSHFSRYITLNFVWSQYQSIRIHKMLAFPFLKILLLSKINLVSLLFFKVNVQLWMIQLMLVVVCVQYPRTEVLSQFSLKEEIKYGLSLFWVA